MSSNRVQLWIDNAVEPVQFLLASYEDFAFPAHLHETFAIGIIERGAQRFKSRGGGAELMPEGTLCAINPGEVHEGSPGSEGGWQYRMFYPPVSLILRALRDDWQRGEQRVPALDHHVIDDPGLFAQYLSLHQASAHQSELLERETRSLLFLRKLFERHASVRFRAPGRFPRTVGIVKDMLHANVAAGVSIVDLADEVGVSETQVIRSFTEQVGMPPHAYLLALRVEHAKHLMLSGLPLSAIAADCGFVDQSHLHRHFKRLTGITPGAFVKAASAR